MHIVCIDWDVSTLSVTGQKKATETHQTKQTFYHTFDKIAVAISAPDECGVNRIYGSCKILADGERSRQLPRFRLP